MYDLVFVPMLVKHVLSCSHNVNLKTLSSITLHSIFEPLSQATTL